MGEMGANCPIFIIFYPESQPQLLQSNTLFCIGLCLTLNNLIGFGPQLGTRIENHYLRGKFERAQPQRRA